MSGHPAFAVSDATKPLFAVSLSTSVPSDIMLALQLDEIVCCTEDSDEWYAVISIGGHDFYDDETGETVFIQEAYIEDVRRKDWELPPGCEDYRDRT